MIEPKTLEKVNKILKHLQEARRLMEDVIDIEKGEWVPGLGSKPIRMVRTESWRYNMVDMQDAIEKTYS